MMRVIAIGVLLVLGSCTQRPEEREVASEPPGQTKPSKVDEKEAGGPPGGEDPKSKPGFETPAARSALADKEEVAAVGKEIPSDLAARAEQYTNRTAEVQRVPPRTDEAYVQGPDKELERPLAADADPELKPDTLKKSELETASQVTPPLDLNGSEVFPRTRVRGPVRRQDGGKWIVEDSARKLSLRFSLSELGSVPGVLARAPQLDAIAGRQMYPDGPVEGLALSEGRRLLYLAESMGDRMILKPEDRRGITFRQVRSPLGSPVLTAVDRKVYEVPVEVRLGAQRLTLKAGGSGGLKLADVPYTITILTSRYTVPASSEYPLEEQTQRIEYVIRPAR